MSGNPFATAPVDPVATGLLGGVARVLGWVNGTAMAASMLALLAACVVLSTGVFLRYFLKVPTDWQDEVSVFLLVGATFFSAGRVQARRGHIGIEVAATLLPPGLDRLRRTLCDVFSLAFCAFFTWKSWTLWYEAWSEGQTTSSEWSPPLAIPYGLMGVGMTLLTLQLLLQCLIAVLVRAPRGEPTATAETAETAS